MSVPAGSPGAVSKRPLDPPAGSRKRRREGGMRAAMKVYSWGRGEDGQLGLGDTTDQDRPCLMDALRDRGVRQIACGSGHTVVLLEEGDVYTWGRGDDGRLGHGDNGWKYVPRRVEELRRHRIVQITCGSYHTAAVTDAGQLFTWGGGMYGKLGHGDENGCCKPALVQRLRELRVAQVACGSRHTVALLHGGAVYTWGDRENGVCGHGADVAEGHQYTPHAVTGLEGMACTQISACGFHSAALSDGQVYTWGEGKFGRLGHGNERNQPTPLRVESLVGQHILQVSCGGFHTAAVTDRGLLFTWGGGEHGQLGHGDKTNRNRPALVVYLAGEDHARRGRVIVRPYATGSGPWGSKDLTGDAAAPLTGPLLQGAAVQAFYATPATRDVYNAGEGTEPSSGPPDGYGTRGLDTAAAAAQDRAAAPPGDAATTAEGTASSERASATAGDAAAAPAPMPVPPDAQANPAGAASREPVRSAAGDNPTPTPGAPEAIVTAAASRTAGDPVTQARQPPLPAAPEVTAATIAALGGPGRGGSTGTPMGAAADPVAQRPLRLGSDAATPRGQAGARATAYFTGSNESLGAEMGVGRTGGMATGASEMSALGVVVTQITCGWSHSVALSSDGDVYTWGNGDHGKLGHGGTKKLTTPTKIESLASVRVCGIASYNEHTATLAFPPPDEPRTVPISTTFLSDMRALRNDDAFADVDFVVGENFGNTARVPAHRAILCARSDHFRAMFGSGMRESQEREVHIPSIRPSVFLAMLEYIYTDGIAITADSAIELYVGADMYALHELKRRCEAILERQISVVNAAELLQVSDALNAKDLRDICIAFIVSNPLCRKSESFRALVRRGGELMVEIMDRMNEGQQGF